MLLQTLMIHLSPSNFCEGTQEENSHTKSLGPDTCQDTPKCDDRHPQSFQVRVLPRQGHRL